MFAQSILSHPDLVFWLRFAVNAIKTLLKENKFCEIVKTHKVKRYNGLKKLHFIYLTVNLILMKIKFTTKAHQGSILTSTFVP